MKLGHAWMKELLRSLHPIEQIILSEIHVQFHPFLINNPHLRGEIMITPEGALDAVYRHYLAVTGAVSGNNITGRILHPNLLEMYISLPYGAEYANRKQIIRAQMELVASKTNGGL